MPAGTIFGQVPPNPSETFQKDIGRLYVAVDQSGGEEWLAHGTPALEQRNPAEGQFDGFLWLIRSGRYSLPASFGRIEHSHEITRKSEYLESGCTVIGIKIAVTPRVFQPRNCTTE
jgi:hypothetical protein